MESIYMLFYKFCATLLGVDIAATEQGEIFCRYAAYAIVAAVIIGLFWGVKKLINLFTFWS